jgi:acyl-CoA thioester hydrolase
MSEPIIHAIEVTVRYQETDQMGVAHHSVYPIWFEAGRTGYIRAHGVPYGKLESDGLYLPLIELTCKYTGFARYEDALQIITRVSGVTKSRIYFTYEAVKTGQVIAAGTTVHVYANKRLKPVNLYKYMPGMYALFLRFAGIDASEPDK